MSRKRERITIIYDILKTIQKQGGRSKPTHILYKSNLSSQMLKDYQSELIEKGFINEEIEKKRNKFYVLTDKGYKYIEEFNVIRNFLESFDLHE